MKKIKKIWIIQLIILTVIIGWLVLYTLNRTGLGRDQFENITPNIRADIEKQIWAMRCSDPSIFFKNPDDEKKAAIALVKIGRPSVEPLIAVLKGKNWFFRLFQDEKEKSVDATDRCKATYVLGNIGDSRAVEPLIDALDDKHACVRWFAAWALGMIKDYRAIEPLIDMLDNNQRDSYERCGKYELFLICYLDGLERSNFNGLSIKDDFVPNFPGFYVFARGEEYIRGLEGISVRHSLGSELITDFEERIDKRATVQYYTAQALVRITHTYYDTQLRLRITDIIGFGDRGVYESDPVKWREWWEKNKLKYSEAKPEYIWIWERKFWEN